MSTDTEPAAAYYCSDCGRNITYSYGAGETPEPDAICVLCMIQGVCDGACGASSDDVAMFDVRVLNRVWLVLEMIQGLIESIEVANEVYQCGGEPLSGIDVDLSEHHLTSGVLDVMFAAGQELMTAFRRLAQSLVATRGDHPGETWFAVDHHPAGALVRDEWERLGT